jgi:hypothetical protein
MIPVEDKYWTSVCTLESGAATCVVCVLLGLYALLLSPGTFVEDCCLVLPFL